MSESALESICEEFSVERADISDGKRPDIINKVLDRISNNRAISIWSVNRINRPIENEHSIPETVYPNDIKILHYCNAILYLAKNHPHIFINLSVSKKDLSLSISLLFKDSLAFRKLIDNIGCSYICNSILLGCFTDIRDFIYFIDERAKAKISSEEAANIIADCINIRTPFLQHALSYALLKLYEFINSIEHKLKVLSINDAISRYCYNPSVSKSRLVFSYLTQECADEPRELVKIKEDLIAIFINTLEYPLHPINKISNMIAAQINILHVFVLREYERLASLSMHDHPIFLQATTKISDKLRAEEAENKQDEKRAFAYVMSSACKEVKVPDIKRDDFPDNVQMLIFTHWLQKVNYAQPEQSPSVAHAHAYLTPQWRIAATDLMQLPDSRLTINDAISLRRHFFPQKP